MSIQAYTTAGYGEASIPNPTIISPRSPTTNDIVSPAGNPYASGQYWENNVANLLFIYAGGGVWDEIAGGSGGPVDSLTGNSGGAVVPTAGNINVLGAGTLAFAGSGSTLTGTITPGTGLISTLTGDSGGARSPTAGNMNLLGTANQITTTGAGSNITFSVPATFVAPGSIAATTTVTATSGAITATSGNFVASAAGTGLVFPVATGSGAAGGTVTCNGRQGSVTFTGPSIAAGATETFTMSNTSITGSGTVIIYTLRGATTGAALTIQSVTNSASQSAIVVTNGTGATTTTANITFDFIVLN